MAKVSDFRDAVELINNKQQTVDEEANISYMSDMSNWICVHATNYKPRRNKNGQLYIESTGMATGYEYPRATVHFTINQIVSGHMGGNWDAQPFVVLAPYNDLVKENTNPQELATEDTYFIPNPDTGLVLPSSTHIIKPNNDTLFTIGETESTYKTDYFTDEEIETILSFVDPFQRAEYEKYDKCDFTEDEVESLLQWEDKLVKENYKKSKDKHAFLHGLFEETRIVILTKFLREMVVRMAMEKMGTRYVLSHEDEISRTVARVAMDNGIAGNSGNKGHSISLEHMFENKSYSYIRLIQMCQTMNIENIYNYFVDAFDYLQECEINIWNIFAKGKSFDMYQVYEQEFLKYIDLKKSFIEEDKERAEKYPDKRIYEKKLQAKLESVKKLESGGIAAYNPYLDTVLHRNAARLSQEYTKALEKLKQHPDYPLLMQMLQDLEKGIKWVKIADTWKKTYDSNADMPRPADLGLNNREM